jgi:hypothetical protein
VEVVVDVVDDVVEVVDDVVLDVVVVVVVELVVGPASTVTLAKIVPARTALFVVSQI